MIINIDKALATKAEPLRTLTVKAMGSHFISPGKFSKYFLESESETFTEEKLKAYSEFKTLLDRMVITCMKDDGIGLAAPQVGIKMPFFIMRNGENTFEACFNPMYVRIKELGTETAQEGCLSVPKVKLYIERAKVIDVRYETVDDDGFIFEAEKKLSGLSARVFQHELDHIHGISIIDREHTMNRAQKRSILNRL